MHPPGWFPDPTGAFEVRYWDGNAWTEHVSANGVQSVSPMPDVVAPLDAAPAQSRWKVVRLVSAVAASVAVLVAVVLFVSEYGSEQDDLAEYRASVQKESARRTALLGQYQKRAKALRKVVATQDEIDDLVVEMKKSDCFQTDPCFGADAWNENLTTLTKLFDKQDALKGKNAKAIGQIRRIAPPGDLWLLSLLGKNDSADVRADLERPIPKIKDARKVINKRIGVINEWNSDCKPNRLISCDGNPDDLALER